MIHGLPALAVATNIVGVLGASQEKWALGMRMVSLRLIYYFVYIIF